MKEFKYVTTILDEEQDRGRKGNEENQSFIHSLNIYSALLYESTLVIS